MGFYKKAPKKFSIVKANDTNAKVAIMKNKDTLCVIENGNVRMRFTTITTADLKELKSPLYSILVP